MFKQIFFLSILSLGLVACGGGNNDPVVTGGPVGYGQNGVAGGNLCPSDVANDWVRWVVENCEHAQRGHQVQRCIGGTQQFQQYHSGLNCVIPIARGRWCTGAGRRNQQFILINDLVIQSIYNQFGGEPNPNWNENGYQGQGGPGQFPGGPGYQQ